MQKIKMILWNLMTAIKSIFVKRDLSIIVCGAWFGERFADNSRFLYQYLSKNKEELGLTHVVWVTRSNDVLNELSEKGYEVYMMDSEESINYHKKAGIHIICNSYHFLDGFKSDILTKYSMGAIKINLWHGLGGIKGINYASNTYLNAKKNAPFKYAVKELIRKQKWYRKICLFYGGWGDCYYLSVSDFGTNILKKYFMLPQKNYIKTGYPRNTEAIQLMRDEEVIIEKVKCMHKTALYLPTFRDNESHYVSPLANKKFVSEISEIGWNWIEKKHGVNEGNENYDDIITSNVLKLPSSFDISTILPHVDIVITDYSSVCWDALYHKKPVLFYVPDFEQYKNSGSGFLLEPDEFLIGPVAYDLNQLLLLMQSDIDNIENLLNKDWFEERRKIWGEDKDISEIWNDIYNISVKGDKL